MPDSPDSLIKNQISSSSSNGLTASVNGTHSPHPPSDTPSPPVSTTSSVPHHLEMAGGNNNNSARGKQVITVKRFLATLQKFANDMAGDIGERVHSLIIGLVSSSMSIEDFQHKVQEITNYPLKPFVIPFLKSHLPLLQTELLHFSRLAKLSPQQYLRQHEHLVLDAAPSHHQASEAPFDLHSHGEGGPKRRSSPPSRNGKSDTDYADTNGDGPPSAKRHHPLPSPTLGSHRTSPIAAGLPPGLSIRVPDTDHGYRMERFDRFDRDFYRPFYGNVQVRDYADDRDMDEEWRNIHTMLNCILGMVEKTKRALCILQHRSYAERPELVPGWARHELDSHPKTKPPRPPGSDLVSHLKIAEDRVSEVRRRAEAVHEVKRQAVAELQKAVTAAEAKASELVAAERIKMERLLADARRQAAEDALAAATHQEESTENCWNCGRKGNETCSGCNIARYCGSFCQHKDWESHHRVCAQSASSNHPTTPPRTNSDHHSSSPSRTSNCLVDIKPIKIDTM